MFFQYFNLLGILCSSESQFKANIQEEKRLSARSDKFLLWHHQLSLFHCFNSNTAYFGGMKCPGIGCFVKSALSNFFFSIWIKCIKSIFWLGGFNLHRPSFCQTKVPFHSSTEAFSKNILILSFWIKKSSKSERDTN